MGESSEKKQQGGKHIFANPLDDSDDLTTVPDGVDLLDGYNSPLFSKEWRMQQPISWKEREGALLQRVDELFDEIDGEGGDQKLSRQEVQKKLEADDLLREYMSLTGRPTTAIFDELDANGDDEISRDEFRKLLTARGHSYSIRWLEEQVVWHELQNRTAGMNDDVERDLRTGKLVSCRDLGQPHPSWCLVFSMLKDGEGRTTDFVSNECAELCNRMWAANLSVDMRRSLDKDEVLILVGISNRILRGEAQEMPLLRMRLAKTKGTICYNESYHEHYTRYTRHLLGETGDMFVFDEDGKPTEDFAGEEYTTIWTSAVKQQVIHHRMLSKGIDLETRIAMPSLKKQISTCRKRVNHGKVMRAQRLKSLLTAAGAFRLRCDEIMGDRVALLAKQCLADPTFTLYPDEAMYSGTPVRQANGVVNDRESTLVPGKVAQIARMQLKVCNEHMLAHGLPVLTYADLNEALSELETYHAPGGRGQGEQFVGSLQMMFPLHDEEELHFLRHNWGSWSLMFKVNVKAKPVEGGNTLAMGHPGLIEQPVRFLGVPTGFLHQPIDEIRDYFGDGTAMYFSWLEMYAKALWVASTFGIPTMLNQWISAGGVDENSLTVWYSVWLSVWSVVFLSVWKRREAELAFLWGSEGLVHSEQPRSRFKGVVKVNEETKREEMVYGSMAMRYMVKAVSTAVILICMLVTASCAFVAMGLKFRAPRTCNAAIREHKEDLGCGHWAILPEEIPANATGWVVKSPAEYNEECCYDMEIPAEEDAWNDLQFIESYKWIIASSLLNLAVIQGMGLVYESIAEWLNDIENYRTPTEYEDQLIVKNFAFQFVNNYFLLFYISYLRQIDWAGKTFGLQVVELSKPFVIRKVKLCLEVCKLQNFAKRVTTAPIKLVTVPVKIVQNAVHAVADTLHPSQQEEDDLEQAVESDAIQAEHEQKLYQRQMNADKLKSSDMNVYELQTFMVNYEARGVFDDFNEMAIQYGYVALFSPCLPLAPFFAFVNNVSEIRGDAWKLCRAYQRPRARPKEAIGAWFGMLNTIGFVAVLTNATMIAFVGSQMAQTEWVVPQDHAAEATRVLAAGDMSREQAKTYVRTLGHPETIVDSVMWTAADANGDDLLQRSEFPSFLDEVAASAMSTISQRVDIAPLWLYAMLIEHMVFVTRVALLSKFPRMPKWIADARELLAFRTNAMNEAVKKRDDMIAGGNFTEDMVGPAKGSLHLTVIEAEGPNDNYVRITLIDSDNVEAGKARKRTRTLEKSGADPKWSDGQGETLIFHGLRLKSITVLVETFDDDIGPTDDLIGSVKFPLKDIGLESVGAPLECWMVLGEANQSMLHHNLFGWTSHGADEKLPPESVGRLRLRLMWRERAKLA